MLLNPPPAQGSSQSGRLPLCSSSDSKESGTTKNTKTTNIGKPDIPASAPPPFVLFVFFVVQYCPLAGSEGMMRGL